jgi:hypothetical protein
MVTVTVTTHLLMVVTRHSASAFPMGRRTILTPVLTVITPAPMVTTIITSHMDITATTIIIGPTDTTATTITGLTGTMAITIMDGTGTTIAATMADRMGVMDLITDTIATLARFRNPTIRVMAGIL